jgi:hypothetical protein
MMTRYDHTFMHRFGAFTGPMIPFDSVVRGEVPKLSSLYYGIEITASDLDVLITMTPNQSQVKMDIDLFVFKESYPFVAESEPTDKINCIFPNRYQQVGSSHSSSTSSDLTI